MHHEHSATQLNNFLISVYNQHTSMTVGWKVSSELMMSSPPFFPHISYINSWFFSFLLLKHVTACTHITIYHNKHYFAFIHCGYKSSYFQSWWNKGFVFFSFFWYNNDIDCPRQSSTFHIFSIYPFHIFWNDWKPGPDFSFKSPKWLGH